MGFCIFFQFTQRVVASTNASEDSSMKKSGTVILSECFRAEVEKDHPDGCQHKVDGGVLALVTGYH